MIRRRWFRYPFIAIGVIAAASVISAFTATNTIPSSRAGNPTRALSVTDLKPPECAGIPAANLVTGAGNVSATNGNDLVLAGPGVDSVEGRNGSDCLLAGGAGDSLDGGAGTDVCIGGPGTDTFRRCETEIQ